MKSLHISWSAHLQSHFEDWKRELSENNERRNLPSDSDYNLVQGVWRVGLTWCASFCETFIFLHGMERSRSCEPLSQTSDSTSLGWILSRSEQNRPIQLPEPFKARSHVERERGWKLFCAGIISRLPPSSSRRESNLLGSSCLDKIQTFIKRLRLLPFEKESLSGTARQGSGGHKCSNAIDLQVDFRRRSGEKLESEDEICPFVVGSYSLQSHLFVIYSQ